ncbi:hypothetical protein ACMD2_22164 [Ananas comosus]|uniref:Uncharacterized protein n=1 Tax=Ananas comosus TaxID=4615 RepID=A0A199V732_ANACO|nr:hypothetical protein ACMD2_22164 [Ananas comosus]
MYPPKEAAPLEWSTGLCGCCEDCSNCKHSLVVLLASAHASPSARLRRSSTEDPPYFRRTK